MVDVEEEEFAIVVVLEAVDETVEGLVAEVGGFVGEDVVDAFVVFHKEGHALSLAYFLTGDVEGDACDPGVEVAFAAEGGPRLPEGTGDFLIEVAEVVAAAVGEVEAYPHQGALAVAEHLQEFCMLARVYFHSGHQPILCPFILCLLPARSEGPLFWVSWLHFGRPLYIISCKNSEKVTRERKFCRD